MIGTTSIADLPISGLNVRVPNIILSNAASGALNVNATPNATLSNRYKITTASAGVIVIDKTNFVWTTAFSNPYSITLTSNSFADQLSVTSVPSTVLIDDCHVGLTGSTIQNTNPITISKCYGGGVINNCYSVRGNNTGVSNTFVNLYDFSISNIRSMYLQNRTGAGNPVLYLNTCDSCVFDNLEIIGGYLDINALSNCTVSNIIFCDVCKGSTTSLNGMSAVNMRGGTNNTIINGLQLMQGLSNVHPYGNFIATNTCINVRIRNIGTALAPINGGSANLTGYLWNDTGNSFDCKLQRCWVTNLRYQLLNIANSSSRLIVENVYNTNETQTVLPYGLNMITRSVRGNSVSPYSFNAIFGTHFWDGYTGDTTTKAGIIFTEKTNNPISAASYSVISGTPIFLATGSITMKNQGDRIVWEFPWFILGWTAITDFAVGGTNTGNHTFEYDIDKGSGFSNVFKTLSSANLVQEIVSPTTGFRLRFRITCITSNTSNSINITEVTGTTTSNLQNTAFRDLDSFTLTLTDLQSGSEVVAFLGSDPNTAIVVSSIPSTGTSAQISHNVGGQIRIFTNYVSWICTY